VVHRVHVETESSATVVSGEGELDAYAAPDLTAAFGETSGHRRVVVDLERVSFLDSTALGLVVRAVRELGERGGEVRVVLPRSAARRIFEITTLDGVLPVSPSRSQALDELTGET
jgi:anti-sigma B factor antagonist